VLRHTGAGLKSGFSRLEFSANVHLGRQTGVIHQLQAVLPASSRNEFLVDRIGNVSTSNVRHTRKNTIFEIRPRFMLFGGWQIDFQFGYQVPSEEFMSTVDGSSDYLLRVPFSHPWENAHTENLTTKVPFFGRFQCCFFFFFF
jgi:oligosaccharyltransferase complex subunit alpha (ribophorin I)